MADNLDFKINIGADVKDLDTEITKAENLLRGFETALKKATTTTDINDLKGKISSVNASIDTMRQRMGSVAKPAGDASQSLLNFSRIAQDAPYGIMGVANNLNPMVESFQRLAATEGGVKNALGAMVTGLVGPAGIGVAIGVVSSLAVTFSKDIKEFFKGPTEELNKFRDELKKVAEEINAIIGKEQTKRTKGILLAEIIAGGTLTQQKEALKQLKNLYSENKAIQDAKIGQDRKYYESLVNSAAAQSANIQNEENYSKQLDLLYAKRNANNKKRKEELDKLDRGEGLGFFKAGKGAYQKRVDELKAEVNKRYDEIGKNIKAQINLLEKNTRSELEKITLIPTPEDLDKQGKAKKPKKDKTLTIEETTLLIKQINKTNELLTPNIEEPGVDTAIEDAKKKRENYQKWLSSNTEKIQKRTKENADNQVKSIEDQTKAYEDFAKSLSGDITNSILGFWDSLQQGESVIDSLGNMFGRLAEQLAAAVIQATIFAAIMSILEPASGGGIGFVGNFFKLLGLAEGGVATGPTLAMIGEGAESEAVLPLSKLSGMLSSTFNAGAMSGNSNGGNGQFVLRGQDLVLALQRSNYALNLRR